MDPKAATTSGPTQPDSPQDRTLPACLASVIALVRILLDHGQRLIKAAADTENTRFLVTIATAAGTHDLARIMARVQRGIMRLIALDRYLKERAETGRDLVISVPHRDIPKPPAQKTEPPTPCPSPTRYNRDSDYLPTQEEIDAEVRRIPIGRTIARACLDLSVLPTFCTGEVGLVLLQSLQYYGGDLHAFYRTVWKREDSYRREREKRPDTWNHDWRDLQRSTIRQSLGWIVGEAPGLDPPRPLMAVA